MIVVVDRHNRAKAGHLLEDAFRLRKRVFVDEMGWELDVVNGKEIDAFDHDDAVHMLAVHANVVVGYQRLLPTTRPFMLPVVFKHLMEVDPPTGPNVFEWTRHCVAPQHREQGGGISRVGSELTAGLLEWALDRSVDSIIVEFSNALGAARDAAAVPRGDARLSPSGRGPGRRRAAAAAQPAHADRAAPAAPIERARSVARGADEGGLTWRAPRRVSGSVRPFDAKAASCSIERAEARPPQLPCRRPARPRSPGRRTSPFSPASGVPQVVLSAADREARRANAPASAALLAAAVVSEEFYYACLARHLDALFIHEPGAIAEPPRAPQAARARIASIGSGLYLLAPEGEAILTLLAARPCGRRIALTTPRRFGAWGAQGGCGRAGERGEPVRLAGSTPRSAPTPRRAGRKSSFSRSSRRRCSPCGFSHGSGGRRRTRSPDWARPSAVILRLLASGAARDRRDPAAPRLTSAELPIYTIIAPLYREADVASRLVAALDRLDYPLAKLDIIFVIEEDDEETGGVLRALNLPSRYEIHRRAGGRAAHQAARAQHRAQRGARRAGDGL